MLPIVYYITPQIHYLAENFLITATKNTIVYLIELVYQLQYYR